MDRLDLVAALRPNASVLGWVRGRDALVWHARIAALGAAALVLANVALSPDRLWAAGPLVVWAAVLLGHAGAAAWTWRAANPASDRPPARRLQAPAIAVADAPLFAADSPKVDRPRFRPTGPEAADAAAAPADASPRSGSGPANDGSRCGPGAAHEDVVVAPTPLATLERTVREDVLVGTVAAPGSIAHAQAAPTRPAGPGRDERQDVAVSATVLPQGAEAGQDGVGLPVQATDLPGRLPDHVVALWRAAPSQPAAGWGVAASFPVDAPFARGWPVAGDAAH